MLMLLLLHHPAGAAGSKGRFYRRPLPTSEQVQLGLKYFNCCEKTFA
jgi:hypothetical protein